MSYLWADGAAQDAPAARTTVYEEVLQAIGSGLATPFAVHCKVPRLESEVRAKRVLDAMVTAGLLSCHARPGRALYRNPGAFTRPEPPKKTERKKIGRANGVFVDVMLVSIAKHKKSTVMTMGSDLFGADKVTDYAERKRLYGIIRSRLTKMLDSGLIEKHGCRTTGIYYTIKGHGNA